MIKYQRRFGIGSVGVCDNVDRISQLPDEVLGHILSYLTTKSAVQTSILSKRWEYVWTLTSTLDFPDQIHCLYFGNEYETKVRSFMNYVNRVLFYHGASFIQKCYFQCSNSHIYPHIYTWVYALIMCNIEELILETGIDKLQVLPRQLFTCKSLVVLKIKGMFVLELPAYVCFPRLKIMSLDDVVYVDDASVLRLFSSCPVLEDLTITRGQFDSMQILNLSISSLRRLCIRCNLYHLKTNINRIFMPINNDQNYKLMTVIDAPYLEYLEIRDNTWNEYGFRPQISGACVLELLNGSSQVRHLVLNGDVNVALITIIENADLPIFSNLTKMELFVGKPPVNWMMLPNLLNSSPNLEVLVFPEGLVVPKSDGKDFYRFYWRPLDTVPECLLFHLKTVEVFNFAGVPGELYLVKDLLKHGQVLEKMIIHSHYSDEVLKMPRSSTTCEVVLTL